MPPSKKETTQALIKIFYSHLDTTPQLAEAIWESQQGKSKIIKNFPELEKSVKKYNRRHRNSTIDDSTFDRCLRYLRDKVPQPIMNDSNKNESIDMEIDHGPEKKRKRENNYSSLSPPRAPLAPSSAGNTPSRRSVKKSTRTPGSASSQRSNRSSASFADRLCLPLMGGISERNEEEEEEELDPFKWACIKIDAFVAPKAIDFAVRGTNETIAAAGLVNAEEMVDPDNGLYDTFVKGMENRQGSDHQKWFKEAVSLSLLNLLMPSC